MIVGSLGRVVNEGFELKDFGQKVANVAKAPLVPGGALIGAGTGLLGGIGAGAGIGAAGGAAIGNKVLYAPGAVLGGAAGGIMGGAIGGAVGMGTGALVGWHGTKKILYGSEDGMKFSKKTAKSILKSKDKFKKNIKKFI